ncbi:MAG: aldo/keto reductase [Pseudomonadota bacterium]|nr:aldo/keto reductase [Pseudomonadota bacterium]
MKKRILGVTDLEVSEICLGTMTWGQQNTQEEGFEQMDYALDMGINFFDTAEMYAVPPKKETQGSTETIIGNWFKERKNRDKVILATKVCGRAPFTWLRDGEIPTEQTKEQIFEAVDKSLKRLSTDYIDLYQLHWPDRPMNLFGGSITYQHVDSSSNSIDSILESLSELIKVGKIRHVGLSNETPWGTMEFIFHSKNKNLPRIQSIQNAYNLLNRIFEFGGSEIAFREKVGLLAYSPLAQGYLTGKYQNGNLPKGSRKELFNRLQRYEGAGSEEAIDAYLNIAKNYNIDPSQLANQFVTTRPFVTSNIIGATNMDQLKLAVTSNQIPLTEEIENEIEEAFKLHGNVAA